MYVHENYRVFDNCILFIVMLDHLMNSLLTKRERERESEVIVQYFFLTNINTTSIPINFNDRKNIGFPVFSEYRLLFFLS